MNLTEQINADIKAAMLAREKEKLEALRAVKSALLLEATKGGNQEVSDDAGMKILQKLHKQRVESATIYKEQNRPDLAEVEEVQAKIIEAYLPKQMTEDEIRIVVKQVIDSVGATGPQDMGKVMGAATQRMAGKADGKLISGIVKEELAKK